MAPKLRTKSWYAKWGYIETWEARRADLRYATIAVSSTGADQGVCADQGLRIPDHLQLRPNEIADLWTLSQ